MQVLKSLPQKASEFLRAPVRAAHNHGPARRSHTAMRSSGDRALQRAQPARTHSSSSGPPGFRSSQAAQAARRTLCRALRHTPGLASSLRARGGDHTPQRAQPARTQQLQCPGQAPRLSLPDCRCARTCLQLHLAASWRGTRTCMRTPRLPESCTAVESHCSAAHTLGASAPTPPALTHECDAVPHTALLQVRRAVAFVEREVGARSGCAFGPRVWDR